MTFLIKVTHRENCYVLQTDTRGRSAYAHPLKALPTTPSAGNAKVHPARQCDDLRALYAGHAHCHSGFNIHLRAHADEASLVKGAFLHDFYLYDWHNCSNITHWHGFKHPRIARYNAEVVFALTDKEKDIIQSHMWPLTPTDIPHSREAALVCMADKMIVEL